MATYYRRCKEWAGAHRHAFSAWYTHWFHGWFARLIMEEPKKKGILETIHLDIDEPQKTREKACKLVWERLVELGLAKEDE